MTEPTFSAGDALTALRALAAERKSGVLAIKRGTAGIHLCLQDGRVVFATSNLKRFQHDHWLTAAELVSGEALSAAGAISGTKELVDNLVRRGNVDRMELVTSLRTLLKEMVLEAVTWDGAELRFSPGAPVLSEQILIDDSAAGLIQEAEKRLHTAPAHPQRPDEAIA
ncbi:MAG: DUF4388 domain-containing protein, partial [Acidobacteria bacterium]|nr:DUF4388 domain-containing protein [Acidobacteriota bacterium]